MLNQQQKKTPENIIIHCGANDISRDADQGKVAANIMNLYNSVSEESGGNVIISGLVPRKEYVNVSWLTRR